MKFGYFDDANKEYVIQNPKTPYPWKKCRLRNPGCPANAPRRYSRPALPWRISQAPKIQDGWPPVRSDSRASSSKVFTHCVRQHGQRFPLHALIIDGVFQILGLSASLVTKMPILMLNDRIRRIV